MSGITRIQKIKVYFVNTGLEQTFILIHPLNIFFYNNKKVLQ